MSILKDKQENKHEKEFMNFFILQSYWTSSWK